MLLVDFYNKEGYDYYSFGTIFLYYSLALCISCIGIAICKSRFKYSRIITPVNSISLDYNFYGYISLFLLLSLFAGIRGEVGSDWFNYKDIFLYSNSNKIFEFGGVEYGFLIYNSIIRTFTDNFNVFLIITSLITNYLFIFTIAKYSNYINPILAVLGYICIFYFQSFNLIRMYLAAAVVFYSMRFIIEKKSLKFLSLMFIAVSLHLSAIVMVLTYIVYKIALRSKVTFFIAYILLFITSIYFKDILALVNPERYMKYLETSNDFGIGFGVIINHLPILYVLYKLRKGYMDKHVYTFLWVCFFMSFWISFMGYFIDTIGRSFVYYAQIFILLIPYYIRKRQLEYKSYRLLFYVFVLYYLFRLHLYFEGYLYGDGLMPYHTFL